MNFLFYKIFFLAFISSLVFTLIVRNIAVLLKIVDIPKGERKIHKGEVAFMGGFAIFLAFFITAFVFRYYLVAGDLQPHHWLAVLIGSCILMVGGVLDDKYELPPKWQFVFPVLAALTVIAGGVGIEKITNPFGHGYLFLDRWQIPIASWGGMTHYFVLIADTFTFLWLLGMMYTTKLLDGLDGLVTGITAIGAFIIFLFTMTDKYYQPDIGIAALILSAACLGFLVFNWNPASIFLGEGGSVFLGFILGVLAIISGGKIAIALLVMGIPILDTAWTIARRLLAGKNPFRFADRSHLHHRLYDSGLGQKKTVLIYYALSAGFGLSALFLQSLGKVFALVFLIIVMAAFVVGFWKSDKKRQIKR